jgi:hypothetical protein
MIKLKKKYQLKKEKKLELTKLTCQTRDPNHETEIIS